MLARQLAAAAVALTLVALTLVGCSTLGDPLFQSFDGPTVDAGPGPDAPPPPDAMPLGPTFESIRQNVLYPQCGARCHLEADPSGRLNMETGDVYSRLVNVPADGVLCGPPETWTRVVPGEPDLSLLYLKVASRHGLVPVPCGSAMPDSPMAFPPITMPQLDAIRMWILDGALDN